MRRDVSQTQQPFGLRREEHGDLVQVDVGRQIQSLVPTNLIRGSQWAVSTLLKMFVGGEWEGSSEGDSFPVFNPANGKEIDSVPKGGKEDVKRAVDSAHEAYRSWSVKPAIERSRVLLKIADVVRATNEELAT